MNTLFSLLAETTFIFVRKINIVATWKTAKFAFELEYNIWAWLPKSGSRLLMESDFEKLLRVKKGIFNRDAFLSTFIRLMMFYFFFFWFNIFENKPSRLSILNMQNCGEMR